jgi:hypothetical protein
VTDISFKPSEIQVEGNEKEGTGFFLREILFKQGSFFNSG